MLVSVKSYLIVVLICIYLKTSDAEHLSTSLLAVCVSSSERVLCPLLNQVVVAVVSCLLGPERENDSVSLPSSIS